MARRQLERFEGDAVTEATTSVEVLSRIAIASILGALIGLERERRGQAAGMRTHALVACGAALFTAVGVVGAVGTQPARMVDPMRVAAQVVAGIGFIGAGAILRDGGSIKGLTTAAALWTSAAVGVCCGAGQHLLAVVGVTTVIGSVLALEAARQRVLHRLIPHHRKLVVVYQRGHGTMGPLVTAIEQSGATIEGLAIDDRGPARRVDIELRARSLAALGRELRIVEARPEIEALGLR